jgi:hypothetical protein
MATTLWPTPDVITKNGVENDTDTMTGSNATSTNGGRQSIEEAIDLLNSILTTVDENATVYTDQNFTPPTASKIYSGTVSSTGTLLNGPAGFGVTKGTDGKYTITFGQTLAGANGVASVNTSDDSYSCMANTANTIMSIYTKKGTVLTDWGFEFIVHAN